MLRNSSPTRACTPRLGKTRDQQSLPPAHPAPHLPAPAAATMPPKKNQNVKEENVLLLGRIGTNLKVGIVGLPNVGSVNQLLQAAKH